ncbi:hypothetical protein E5A73_09880 [Sphingomonas gei]|uniref:Bacterial Ig-like domain-containing protein n=1 Tax=Sphingomonas gei TaxID=1395960 RepID=A0A4S1XA69_9SPHN|nr:Ig-like domain-containing protein [Sphingomonas gei]TGX53169.1 hypothetical protein E5A73_09880 [Sphingomonas gei]
MKLKWLMALLPAVLSGCGGNTAPTPPKDTVAPIATIAPATDLASLRVEQHGKVSLVFSEVPVGFSVQDDLHVSGATVISSTQHSETNFTVEVESTISSGQSVSFEIPSGSFTDATGNGNARAALLIPVNDQPPLIYSPTFTALTYTPETRYSYYTFGGTVAFDYTAFEAPKLIGDSLKSDLLVLSQGSKTLSRIDSKGDVAWTYPTGGRFVFADENFIFVSDLTDLTIVHLLDGAGKLVKDLKFDMDINYVATSGDSLIVVYNTIAPVDVYGWDKNTGLGSLKFSSLSVSYARSASLLNDNLAIADTFGDRTVVQSVRDGKIIMNRSTYYANDVEWRGDFVYVVEEHHDRVIAINILTGKSFVVLAPPIIGYWDANITLGSAPRYTCNSGSSLRLGASDTCSGMMTLYAPNGIKLLKDGMWLADTDNSRVIFVKDGEVVSTLSGFNNPVKVAIPPGS